MSGEGKFLLAAVRRFFDPEEPFPNSDGLDWTKLFRLASYHAVTPVLSRTIKDLPLSQDVSSQLRALLKEGVAWSFTLSAELARLAKLFEEHAIAFVPLKGPLLSQRLYGNISIRSSADLDFLVHRSAMLKAREVLIAQGYRDESIRHWPCDSAYLRCRGSEFSFVDDSRSLSVDLHWRVLPSYFASPFDEVDVWKSMVTTRFAGHDMPDLEMEELLLFLCAHGSKHAFRRLGWICDIASCLIAFPDLNWPALMSTSRRCGTTRQLLLGLRLAAELLGAPLPSGLPDDRAVESLVGTVKTRLLDIDSPARRPSDDIPLCLSLMERQRHRLRYLAGNLFEPSAVEYQALQLPPSLYALYYLFRPLRLSLARYDQNRSRIRVRLRR